MLSHLSLMIASAPVFPIVGYGRAQIRPVHADDVAAGVVAALQKSCSGKIYDIVGPDRLQLRDVVRLVARAMELPLKICPTPVALMRLPVWLLERFMKQPLSTRAQLAMLSEGLDGDPEPARRDLGLETAPFTVKRIRPILASVDRVAPLNLRLFSIRKPTAEIPTAVFRPLLLLALFALSFAFLAVSDRWTAMTAVMAPALSLFFLNGVHRHLRPAVFGVIAGVVAGLLLYGITVVVARLLPPVWPGWESSARELYSWADGHSMSFLIPTLVMIVIAEELLWRGIIMRFLVERWGKGAGIAAGAAIYALAHWASLNPLLLGAAAGCGLFWGWLFVVSDDLTVPIVSHLVWDSLCLFLLPVVH
jgi:membrane protease YdiL (CAAX protease family)